MARPCNLVICNLRNLRNLRNLQIEIFLHCNLRNLQMTKTQFIVPNFEKKSNRLYLTLRKNEGIVLIFDEKRPTLIQFIYFLHLYCHLRISNHPLKHKKGEFSTKKHKKGATCCCAAADSRILQYPGDSTTVSGTITVHCTVYGR